MKRCRPALGTFVEVEVHAVGDRDASSARAANGSAIDAAMQAAMQAAIEAAFAAVDRVEASMSFHDAGSELSRLNATAHRAALQVSEPLYHVLAAARMLFERSDGVFDCAVGARLAQWNLLPRHHDDAWLHEALGGTMADVDLLADHHVAYRRPLCIDLGGIAKGHAVDRAIDALAGHGIASAVVNAGGDLRVLGTRSRPIHVRDPLDPARLRYAGRLADGAMATSGSYRSRQGAAGNTRSALVDPVHDRAVVEDRSWSVVAPTCMVADALTKVLAAAPRRSAALLDAYGAHALVF